MEVHVAPIKQLNKMIFRVEYIKAACPTCENVRCGEGMECKMVEDLPQCVIRIPGGCEVDKCGEGKFSKVTTHQLAVWSDLMVLII